MNLGKLIRRNDGVFIKDLTNETRHYVPSYIEGTDLKLGEYYSFEINENDDAVDLVPADKALSDYGIQGSTGSFYTVKNENDDAEEAETYFGSCELTGMRGDIVPCLYLDTEGNVVEVNAGTWLVHSVLGKLAGAF